MSGDPPQFTMDESALGMHEVYQGLRKAGFGRWEALWLVGCLLKGVPIPDWFADKLRNAEED